MGHPVGVGALLLMGSAPGGGWAIAPIQEAQGGLSLTWGVLLVTAP